MPDIDYESDGFPSSGPVANGSNVLSVSWDDLLWAAITVGRPNRNYVFRNGNSSLYEALFRISAVRMSLEQVGPLATHLPGNDVWPAPSRRSVSECTEATPAQLLQAGYGGYGHDLGALDSATS